MEERSGGRPFVEHHLSAELHLILPFALSPAFQGKVVCRSGGLVPASAWNFQRVGDATSDGGLLPWDPRGIRAWG